jgi:hypothetical protein
MIKIGITVLLSGIVLVGYTSYVARNTASPLNSVLLIVGVFLMGLGIAMINRQRTK